MIVQDFVRRRLVPAGNVSARVRTPTGSWGTHSDELRTLFEVVATRGEASDRRCIMSGLIDPA